MRIRDIKTPETASNRHLAKIIRDYLASAPYATEKRLDSEITLNHSVEELEKLLDDPGYSYLLHIDSAKMANVKRKFGISPESDQSRPKFDHVETP